MYKQGFTLIELVVVVGILSIIMLIVSQPVASIIKYQRESQTADNMRDNLQFAINIIEKDLKTSSEVSIINQSEFSFKDQNGANIVYKLDGNIIKKTQNGTTSNYIDNSLFTVTNFKVWNNSTQLVTVLIEAKSLDSKDKVSMQTSVYPLNNK